MRSECPWQNGKKARELTAVAKLSAFMIGKEESPHDGWIAVLVGFVAGFVIGYLVGSF